MYPLLVVRRGTVRGIDGAPLALVAAARVQRQRRGRRRFGLIGVDVVAVVVHDVVGVVGVVVDYNGHPDEVGHRTPGLGRDPDYGTPDTTRGRQSNKAGGIRGRNVGLWRRGRSQRLGKTKIVVVSDAVAVVVVVVLHVVAIAVAAAASAAAAAVGRSEHARFQLLEIEKVEVVQAEPVLQEFLFLIQKVFPFLVFVLDVLVVDGEVVRDLSSYPDLPFDRGHLQGLPGVNSGLHDLLGGPLVQGGLVL